MQLTAGMTLLLCRPGLTCAAFLLVIICGIVFLLGGSGGDYEFTESIALAAPHSQCEGRQHLDFISSTDTVNGKTVLLVTMALGKAYLHEYRLVMQGVHQRYAQRHGYDFKVVTKNIGNDTDIVSFAKALLVTLPCAQNYDFLVYVDCDVWIRRDAPPIHRAMDFGDKVGIVDEYAQPTPSLRKQYQHLQNYADKTAEEYYRLAGFQLNTTHVLNTGVMVLQPKKHKMLFQSIYEKHLRSVHPRGKHFEQSAIGFELQVNDKFALLDSDWNGIWALYEYFDHRITQAAFIREHSFSHFTSRKFFSVKLQQQLIKDGL